MRRTLLSILCIPMMVLVGCTGSSQSSSPDALFAALVKAAESGDSASIAAVFGPGGEDIASSGDEIADRNAREAFLGLARESIVFEKTDDGKTIAVLGRDRWPFPVPLVQEGGSWKFDTATAKDEILNRRIGANELKTLATLRAFCDAQMEYYSRGRDGNRRAFAQKLHSTPGLHDGLYWDTPEGDEVSPMGALVAMAEAEGYPAQKVEGPHTPHGGRGPYHGYFYKNLKAQGPHGPGGERSYVRDGLQTEGFALVAWPADYGNSGIMTFVINHQGVAFQKDLGPETDKIASGMTAYDPDESWYPTAD